MKLFEFEYTFDRENNYVASIKANSLTTALLEFTSKYPDAEYFDYKEIKENEDNL